MITADKQPLLSVSEQLGELAGNLTKLFRLEVQLAKTEVRESGKIALEKSGLLVTGAALLLAALFAAVGAAVVGLSSLMPLWAAFLTTSAIVALAGGLTIYIGLEKIKAQPIAPKFRSTMQKNKEQLLEVA